MSGGSVPNDRIEPIRGGVAVNIAAADHTFTTAQEVRAIYVGSSGDLSVVTVDGSALTFANVLGGSIVPIHARTVVKASTTCTDMVAVW